MRLCSCCFIIIMEHVVNTKWKKSRLVHHYIGGSSTYYTGAINCSLLKSYFAWPSCVYLIKNPMKKSSCMKHLCTVIENISQSGGFSIGDIVLIDVRIKPSDWLLQCHNGPIYVLYKTI